MRDARTGGRLGGVTLEMSLKPVRAYDERTLAELARTVVDQWRPLLQTAARTEVMLWASDGSELLDFRGDLAERFEWGAYIGFANLGHDAYGKPVPPARQGVLYTEAPARPTYGDLRRLVATLRAALADELGTEVRIGTTFDTGPEFAESDFKFVRHPEVMARGTDIGIASNVAMLRHGTSLHADPREYAGFPRGVPEGTSFGTFLGRQTAAYLPAMGFDYLWLSNGFGFSWYAWTAAGSAFDGERFDGAAAARSREATLRFWEDFRAEFDGEVRVRGTNHTVGIDVGSDGVPSQEIFERGYVSMPPPNSPWGPLNRDFGIELTGYMSRIAVPDDPSFMFRFYANDPWFWQQPWWDFYHREPFDIDLMTSVARLSDEGAARTADHVQILAIDTSRGELDERCGREVSTAILQSLEAQPDEAGPLVWVYPYEEYHAPPAAADAGGLARGYGEDLALTAAVGCGLPVNTVCSTSDISGALASGTLLGRILVAPTTVLRPSAGRPQGVRAALESHLRGGGDVLLYGSLGGLGDLARDWLGLDSTAPPVEGSADLIGFDRVAADTVDGVSATVRPRIRHVAVLSDGGLVEVAASPDGDGSAADGEVVIEADVDGERRAYLARSRPVGATGGRLVWVRGSSAGIDVTTDDTGTRAPSDGDRHLDPGVLLRAAAGLLGLVVRHELRTPSSDPVVSTVHRSNGAYWFSSYAADTTVRVAYRLPAGAPVLMTRECFYDADGTAVYQPSKSVRAECRVLIERAEPGVISCRDLAPQPAAMIRSIEVTGLRAADITLLPPPGAGGTLRIEVDGEELDEPLARYRTHGGAIPLRGITGAVSLTW